MIQIDIEMPESCEDCPFRGETYNRCPLVPMVAAWQKEISDECRYRRSEHCPLEKVIVFNKVEDPKTGDLGMANFLLKLRDRNKMPIDEDEYIFIGNIAGRLIDIHDLGM